MKYYLAYGSNLNKAQMAFRCPDAKPIGKTRLPKYELVFRRGFLTVEPKRGSSVPVGVWEISDQDEKNLDRYEGCPEYYRKENLAVTMTDLDGKNPQEITAMVYIMEDGHRLMAPWQSYYDVLAEGYERFGFNPYQLELALKEVKEGS